MMGTHVSRRALYGAQGDYVNASMALLQYAGAGLLQRA
jgi:hypothetical protein